MSNIIWFIIWWSTWSPTNSIEWINNTDTTTPSHINPSATLALARYGLSWVSSWEIWFTSWWYTWSANSNEIDWFSDIHTTTPTWINPSNTLPDGSRRSHDWVFNWNAN